MTRPRLTTQSVEILGYLLTAPAKEAHGYEVMKECNLNSATLYRNLARFRRFGWVDWRTEDIDPEAEGRPRRTYYRLTAEGVQVAEAAITSILRFAPTHGVSS